MGDRLRYDPPVSDAPDRGSRVPPAERLAEVMEARETYLSPEEIESRIEQLQAQMRQAAANLDFERAAKLRDKIKTLKGRELGFAAAGSTRS